MEGTFTTARRAYTINDVDSAGGPTCLLPGKRSVARVAREIPPMKTHAAWVGLLILAGIGLIGSNGLCAAVTGEHKKQIAEIAKETTRANSLITKKDFDDAARLLDDAEKKLKQIAKAADVKETDPLIAAPLKKISAARELLAQKRPAGAAKTSERDVAQASRPTGKETVSFTKDIAPFMVNLCLNCHSGNSPRSGFSLETFEKLMKGGDSGRVVLPGNTKDSRLWHLVGEQDPIKMPPRQALITRTNHSNLRKWIEEGAKFDGPDVKATLRSLVPTEAEKRAKEIASLSTEDLVKRRKDRANQLWKAALSSDAPEVHETDAFIVMGNVEESRLKQVGEWAGASAERLRKLFKIKDAAIWRGKLTVFVFKNRFAYVEFALTNEKVEIPNETHGHSRVSSTGDEAYICVLDIGDSPTESSPGVRTLLTGLLAEGLLQRLPNRVPDWASKGTGMLVASQSDPKNPYFRGLTAGAHEAVRSLKKPDELIANGTFSPADLPAVGFTLVNFMLKSGGEPRFVDFLSQLAGGKKQTEALSGVYNVDVTNLARSYYAYVESLPGSKVAAKKKK